MVAQTIQNQLMGLGRTVVWSWGAHAWKGLGENQLQADLGTHLGALVFKVQGRLFNGHVAIALRPNDTYAISFGRLVKGRFQVKSQVDEVYFDQMLEIIDSRVETPE